jgi:hypothetical protein
MFVNFKLGWEKKKRLFPSLGASAEGKKASISFPLYYRIEQLGSSSAEFHEICHFKIFRESVEGIKILLKTDKSSVKFT